MEQQYNNMYYDEDEINLKELLIAVLRKWRIIVLCAIIFAILGGAYKGISGFMKLQDAEYMEDQRKTVTEAKEQYDIQKELYETQLKNLENEIRTLNAYREKSVYMNIDPFNEYHETVTYYISTDYKIMPGMDYQNINQAVSILNAYVRRVQNFDVYGEAINLIGKDMTVSDIKELVQVQQDNTNFMFTVTIIGPDEKIPRVLIDTVRQTVESSKKDIEKTIGKHSLKEVMANSGYTVDTVLSDNKIKFEDNITKLHDALAKKQKAIDDLKKPSSVMLSEKGVLKQTIKFAIIGGCAGGFLIFLWICALFLLGDRLPNETTLMDKYGIQVIGSCRSRIEKGPFSFIDSYIDRFDGIGASDYDEEYSFQLAAANLESNTKEGSNIVFFGTLSRERLFEIYFRISENLRNNNLTLIEGGNLIEDSEAIRKLAEADAVVFVECRKKTKFEQLKKEWRIVTRQKKEICGLFLT